VGEDNLADFFAAGVFAVGIGSALYKPGKAASEIAREAAGMVSAYRKQVPAA